MAHTLPNTGHIAGAADVASPWMFTTAELDQAVAFHTANGFVAFADIFATDEISELRRCIDQLTQSGRLKIGENEFASNNDIVIDNEPLWRLCCDSRIVRIARRLVSRSIELQHAKFNAKPKRDAGAGEVRWHQDYPFYPHTNYDLVSCVIHIDDEDLDSGPLRFVPGSHRMGPLSHVRADGSFAYECTDIDNLNALESTVLTGPSGFVSFHHCLTLHTSAPKQRIGDRRLIIFQYRATDAAQIAGVVWKCNGMQVEEEPPRARKARFPDGTVVELRGNGGRLFDVGGVLAPDRGNG